MKRITVWAVVALALSACQKDISDVASKELSPAGALAAAKVAASGSSATEQSIMVDIDAQEDFINISNEIWQYEDELAAADFAATEGKDYATLSSRDKKPYDQMAKDQKCSYWEQEGHPFWTLKKTTGEGGSGETALDINFIIAAESAVKNNKKDLTKYSFSLTDRVSDLKVAVVDEATGAAVWTSGEMPLVAGVNYEIVGGAAYGDIVYNANGYSTPGAALLVNDKTIAQIIGMNGYGDNNVTVGNTEIVRLLAPIATGDLDLQNGRYLVKVTGVIKSNAADAAGQPFSVKGGGIIVAAGCGQPEQL